MQTRHRWLFAVPISIVAACSSPALARAGHVTVRLEPDTVAAGEDATLAVTIDDESLAPPSLPDVAGLDLQSIGEQTNMTMINGVTQRSVTYLYRVAATQPGEFTIAGIRSGGSIAPPLTLHVTASGSNRSSAVPAGNAALPQAMPTQRQGDLAFMRLVVDKQRLYAGQSVPFTVQAYFRGGTGVAVKGRPELSSDAFTVSGLDDSPTQNQVMHAGVPYLAVTWRGSLTAVKSGDHPLDMSLPVSLQYRQTQPAAPAQPRHSLRDLLGANSPFGSMMQDPFFDSMLDQPMFDGLLEPGHIVTRDITLRGRAGQAHVLPLPQANKPSDFSGAVGQFDLHVASLSNTRLTRGEPTDLHFAITGRGNFGQFHAQGLSESDAWKTYAAHDTFQASDKLGLSGTSQYVQPVAAKRSGDLEMPGLRFSYFDPSAQRYVTKTTATLAFHVAEPALADSAAPTSTQLRQPPVATDDTAVRSLIDGGVPNWLLPLGAAALALGLLVAVGVRWMRSAHPARYFERRRSARLIARERRAMQRAARAGDRVAYLRSGRHAIQQRLAESWHVTPESITAHELERRWPTAPDTIRRMFELADQADYAGGRLSSAPELSDLPAWFDRVDSQIAHMEVPS